MGKFLVIIAIVLTAASAVLGYLNQVKLAEVKKQAADAEIAASQAKTQLAKTQGDLKTASQNLQSTVTEKDQLNTKLSGAQTELEKSKGQVAQLTNDRTSLEGQISQLTADLQAKTQELEQKSHTPVRPTRPKVALTSRLSWRNSKRSSPSCRAIWTRHAPSWPPSKERKKTGCVKRCATVLRAESSR